jgi:CheY-like chemotaxis protein
VLGPADGAELFAEIRRRLERPIALVLMSGWTRTDEPPAPGIVFLRKPFDADELQAALDQAAERNL